jgi:hypothetical protein
MMRSQRVHLSTILLMLTAAVIGGCNDQLNVEPVTTTVQATTTSTTTLTAPATSATMDCSSCTYVVPSNTTIVDGAALKLAPGSVICLSASNQYGSMIFRNIVGTAASPILIRNCGGVALVDGTGKGHAIRTESSKYFRITGGTEVPHGIRLTGGNMGLILEKYSTEFEIDRIEVFNVGFAGIMAKTEPTCDDATIRGNFTMRNVSFHHNYVHDTGGEGFYIGHSFYGTGKTLSCGVRLPHDIEYVKIFNNVVKNSGWEAIQVGSAPKGAMVFNNKIENYGVADKLYQNNGIQFGEGAPGVCFANYINGGKGVGLVIVGNAENFIHDNVFINTGEMAIFVDERAARGTGFKIINNTIINPGTDGIRLYTEYVPNVVKNNIIVNPGNFSFYTYPRASADSYLYLLNKSVPLDASNNILTTDIATLGFVNAALNNYRLVPGSAAIDAGADISTYKIATDFSKLPRLKGAGYDIGACEFQQ